MLNVMNFLVLAGGLTQKMEGLVEKAAALIAAFIAIVLIFRIGKKAWTYIKGSGEASIWSIIADVLVLLLMIGIVYVAMNYKNLGNKAANVANQAINIIEDTANDIGN